MRRSVRYSDPIGTVTYLKAIINRTEFCCDDCIGDGKIFWKNIDVESAFMLYQLVFLIKQSASDKIIHKVRSPPNRFQFPEENILCQE